MPVILALSGLALLSGATALTMAERDFRKRSTFRPSTAIAIYAGWALHAAAFLAAVVLDAYRVEVPPLIARAVGTVLIGAGVLLFVFAVGRFQSFGQVTGTDTGGLVTSGIYGFSRNPQYTGWIMLLVGGAVAARSPLAVALAVAVVIAMRVWIPQEERHLEEQFGDEYRRYRRRVPRFIAFSPRTRTTR